MPKLFAAMSCLLILCGCKAHRPGTPPSPKNDLDGFESGSSGPRAGPHVGQWAVAIVSTPVYLATKTVVCSASFVVAAPVAAVIARSDSSYALGVEMLGDGVAINCGPPYALSQS